MLSPSFFSVFDAHEEWLSASRQQSSTCSILVDDKAIKWNAIKWYCYLKDLNICSINWTFTGTFFSDEKGRGKGWLITNHGRICVVAEMNKSWSQPKPGFKSTIFYLPAMWPRKGIQSLWALVSSLAMLGINSFPITALQSSVPSMSMRSMCTRPLTSLPNS